MVRCGGSSRASGERTTENCVTGKSSRFARRCTPRYELVPVVWRKVEDQEERLRRLTEQQHRLLDYLAQQPKAAIRGVAGSGKTMLALAKAQREARAGRRTLLLCYNQPLQDWLKAAVPESFANELVVLNYHSLASRLCQEAGVPLWERRPLRHALREARGSRRRAWRARAEDRTHRLIPAIVRRVKACLLVGQYFRVAETF